jgi:hypothetical protein
MYCTFGIYNETIIYAKFLLLVLSHAHVKYSL